MRARTRRLAQRVLEVLDFRTFVVAGAVGTLLLIAYLVYTSTTRADRAFDALDANVQQSLDIRAAQTRRIDLLEQQVALNSQRLGEAIEANRALAAQLRALGVEPVTTGPTLGTTDSNGDGGQDLGGAASPSTSTRPEPQPSGRQSAPPRPTGRPSPSPTPSPRPTSQPTPLLCRVPLVCQIGA